MASGHIACDSERILLAANSEFANTVHLKVRVGSMQGIRTHAKVTGKEKQLVLASIYAGQ